MENNLSLALRDSISEEASSTLTDIAEVGLDSILDDSLFKDIPLISTALSLYRIGRSVKERHYVKKLAQFISSLNNGVVDEDSRDYYKKKLEGGNKQRNHELEYIMILIDRYISYDKPDMLAKLYLAYLREDILWQEFAMYAEAIDRFLPGDCSLLCSDADKFISRRNLGVEAILRLISLGLLCETTTSTLFTDDGHGGISVTTASMNRTRMQEKTYKRTEFGEQLATILR